MHNNRSLNWYVETSCAILHIALSSWSAYFLWIPAARPSIRYGRAGERIGERIKRVLLRPREKSWVYRRGTCMRKKRKEATDRVHQRRIPRPGEPIVHSPRSFAYGTSYYIIAIKWRVVVLFVLCLRSDGERNIKAIKWFNDL